MSQETAERAAGALSPELGHLLSADPAGLARAFWEALSGGLGQPLPSGLAVGQWTSDLASAWWAAFVRAIGGKETGPLSVQQGDRRFEDPTWRENPFFFLILQSYLATNRLLDELVHIPELSERTRRKAELYLDLLVAALSPTNVLVTNPTALKRAFETSGLSLIAGARNFADDLFHNGGRPRQVDASRFQVGVDLAVTPGKVVFRNDLMELVQYLPQTDEVYEHPLLASPPWINKYYIMDLAPGRSFIEWAVQHGHTTFAISYRDPDASMASVTLDDYLIHGPQTALEVIVDITGIRTVDVVGLCLGGALTAMTASYLAAVGDDRLGTLTLLNTMLDYSEPGVLGAFTDEASVAHVERAMARKGYLEGSAMSQTFDALRPNELIFNYVVSNWLLGESPPAFDILAWNSDSTRMPAAMHSFYLRSCYLENRLARGELTLAGEPIHLDAVEGDVYVVSAINDHIVPWRSAYETRRLLGGDVRFVLSNGGHIAGIVNPPGPKPWYLTDGADSASPDEWEKSATRHHGSWWEDWTAWSSSRAGKSVQPPPMGSKRYPATDEAPGRFVRG
jgi:polyhydroxyalkanoate synthase